MQYMEVHLLRYTIAYNLHKFIKIQETKSKGFVSPKTFRKPVQNVSLDILFLGNVILNTIIIFEKLFKFFKQRYLT